MSDQTRQPKHAKRPTPRGGAPVGGRSSQPKPGGRRRGHRLLRVLSLLAVVALVVVGGYLSGAWTGLVQGVSSMVGSPTDQAFPDSPAPTVMDQEAPPPDPVDINLVMIGDILQHEGVYQSGLQADGTYNFDHVYAHIASSLEAQDIKILNQETPLGGTAMGLASWPVFNGPQEMGDAEAKVGFNVILKASNHAMDRGYDGIHAEQDFWRTKYPDIKVVGEIDPQAGDTGSPYDAVMYEKDGFKVAILNYTYDLNGFADPKGAVAILEEEPVRRSIQAARDQGADLVVACPHWGVEYQTTVSDHQRKWSQVFVDAGVDVIIGAHPHVIAPVEVLSREDGHQTLCFWSLGNFICTQQGESLVGGMAKVHLRKESDGTAHVVSWAFDPLVINKGRGANMTTYLARDWTDQLAAAGPVRSMTPAWVNDFCARVLGEGYDPTTGELTGTMGESASQEAQADEAGQTEAAVQEDEAGQVGAAA